ncbi:TerC family protein [Shouchella clausii]|uniref:TerC family protein n=1 Tax=Shouchella clausii TaxID=79880 RepID=UPI001C24340E|nr:TerC family protein [Shouchella clausii]MBU8597129.1 TerC family protein [Shouchella clausii]MED4159434.1 TerC family protein [Shouchella clausii]MED4176153.1 TerC family protein [Shouchella clausii]
MPLLLEYGWVLLVLIALEGILAADNAVVLAMIVRHLPENERKKALFYGLAGAFLFRIISLFFISLLVDVWQIQAIGAIYLLYLSIHYLYRKWIKKKTKSAKAMKAPVGFWKTVVKVELADFAFAVDSILAAVALAVTLPATNWPNIGQLDGAQFAVVLSGGIIGVVIMRFAAGKFIKLLEWRPSLETAAYLIVGWVGVKLLVYTLAHPDLHILPEHFPESSLWKTIFWTVFAGIVLIAWFKSSKDLKKASLQP